MTNSILDYFRLCYAFTKHGTFITLNTDHICLMETGGDNDGSSCNKFWYVFHCVYTPLCVGPLCVFEMRVKSTGNYTRYILSNYGLNLYACFVSI